MTVYSRKTAAGLVWRYDFRLDGERFVSPETYTSKRDATAAEKARRRDARDGVQALPGVAPRSRKRGVTLKAACDLFWNDIGRHHRSAADIERRLAIVRRLIGDAVLVVDIRFATVNDAVQTRRAEPGRQGKPLAPSTVNLDVIDQLRPVINHAARVHELALPTIDWAKARLKVSNRVVREFEVDEQKRWARELKEPIERQFLHLALRYGPRLGELFFPPDAFKRDARGRPILELGRYLSKEGVWRESRKDGSLHPVALMDEDAELLEDLVDRAQDRGAPHVWLNNAGTLLTYYAMRGRLVRAAARAGIDPGRIIHGMRHHAGTQMARQGLGLAKDLLGHKQIETTMRYAHTNTDDMRAALDRVAAPARGR